MHAATDAIIPKPINVFALGAPPGDLDTPSYNAAVSHLRNLGVIETVVDPSTHSVTFRWTYMGFLVLQKLGLRHEIPENAG
jgi:hypothetical protein